MGWLMSGCQGSSWGRSITTTSQPQATHWRSSAPLTGPHAELELAQRLNEGHGLDVAHLQHSAAQRSAARLSTACRRTPCTASHWPHTGHGTCITSNTHASRRARPPRTVPPSSMMQTSGRPSRPSTAVCATRSIQSWMASVMWGTTCRGAPEGRRLRLQPGPATAPAAPQQRQ